MKKSTFVAIAALACLIFAFSMKELIGNAGTPPASKTGAPSENRCNQCHTGTAGTGSVSMVIGSGQTTYQPNQLYTITTSVNDPNFSRFGFEITALANGTGPSVGTFALTNTANTSLINGTVAGNLRRYVSHRTANGTSTWSFNWTSPSSDVGPITFYLVGLAANNNNSSSGDKLYSTTSTITFLPAGPPAAAFSASSGSICEGLSVNFTDQSTNTPSSYQWSFPGGNPSTSTTVSPNVSYAAAGTYSVTLIVTNALGSDTLEQTDLITVTAPPQLVALANDASCNGGSDGSIDLVVTGNGPFSYNWSNGTTGEDPSGLLAGGYQVTVTDGNGCTGNANFQVGEASAIVLTASSQPATCGASDGSATVSAAGGTPGYTYLWQNGDTSAGIQGLAAGTYSVTVTDANGCNAFSTVGVSNLNAPTATFSMNAVSCAGGSDGSIDLSITGGQAPFTFLWSNGETTEDISGLSTGLYNVTVTSANGCILSEVVSVSEPAALQGSLSITPEVSGNDGAVAVTVSGGTTPYAFLWSNGGTQAQISGLAAGNYTVTITDANGCEFVDSATVPLDVAVQGALQQDLFRVGPSPFKYDFQLFPNRMITGKLVVHLIDIKGNVVFAEELRSNGLNALKVSPGPIPNGIYLLVVRAGENKLVHKVIKDNR